MPEQRFERPAPGWAAEEAATDRGWSSDGSHRVASGRGGDSVAGTSLPVSAPRPRAVAQCRWRAEACRAVHGAAYA